MQQEVAECSTRLSLGEEMNNKINETINALCDWIQAELKNASSVDTESILPAVIDATAKLVDANRF